MRSILFSITLVALSACTIIDRDKSPDEPAEFVGIRDGALVYEGGIDSHANSRLFKAYDLSSYKPTRLVVSSVGGDIEAGLELGEWVRDNHLEVEVDKVCASSCANYVFTAGSRKILSSDSIILWHGSAWQRKWKGSSDEWAVKLNALRNRETEFFASLNIDNQLCTYGQYHIPPILHIAALFGKGSQGYDYSLDDMQRFGIRNIDLKDGSWDWREKMPDKAHLVTRIEVKSDYKFTIRRYEI